MLLFCFLAAVVPGVTLGESTQVVTAGQRRCGVGERSGKAIGCALELAGFGKGENGRDKNRRGDVGGGESAVPVRSESQSVDGARRRAAAAARVRAAHQGWPVPTGGEAGQPRSSP